MILNAQTVALLRRWLVVPALGTIMLLTAGAPATESEPSYAPEAPRLTHGPFLGAVSDTGVKIWGRGAADEPFEVEVRPEGQPWQGLTFGPGRMEDGRDSSSVIAVSGLVPSTSYEYRPLLNGHVVDTGDSFKTLPPVGQPGTFRFMAGGDLSAEFAPFSILDRVTEQRPDFGILLGDLVYSDHPRGIPPVAEAYFAKYRANWSDVSFRRLTRLVPSFMMWDDHEIMNDYDGRDPERYGAARTALEAYATRQNPSPRRTRGLYYSFQVADVDFFAMDLRSYRSPDVMPDGPQKTMLGSEQKADVKEWLSSSRATFKILLSSVPVHDFGAERRDAWAAFASERTELLEFIGANNITGVVILSGDQHWSSLVRHDPYDVWEFNATPLAQQVRTNHQRSAPGLSIVYDASPAFGIIDVDTKSPNPAITFSVVDNAGVVRASKAVQRGRAG